MKLSHFLISILLFSICISSSAQNTYEEYRALFDSEEYTANELYDLFKIEYNHAKEESNIQHQYDQRQ